MLALAVSITCHMMDSEHAAPFGPTLVLDMPACRPWGYDSKPQVTWSDNSSITQTLSGAGPRSGSIESIGWVNPQRKISARVNPEGMSLLSHSSSVCFILILSRALRGFIYQGIHKKYVKKNLIRFCVAEPLLWYFFILVTISRPVRVVLLSCGDVSS